jgi:iron(III) transport system ATP-binding protein
MTTADLIAVMNAGRIEQLGTPQEVYEEPRSEFVARFLGGSNILRGKALDATRVACAGTALDCSGRPLVPGADVAVSIRQHEIAIAGGEASAADNQVPGTVVRNVFLGAARDYIVEAKDGTQLRITAAPRENFAPGTSVWLTLPARRCRALAD